MNQDDQVAKGGCLCGAIRYRATGSPGGSGYCHCRSCRHHTGAPVVVLVMFTSDQVAWVSGERARYESSSGVFRAFCPDCGTPLTWEGDDAGTELVQFHIGTLDNPDAFPPRDHTHCGEQISWFETADRLPRYQGSLE